MPDHIHMLISFPPSKAPASAIKALKGRSAYIFFFYKIIQKYDVANIGAVIFGRQVTI